MKKKIAVLTSGWTVDYVISLINGMRHVCENNNTDLYVFTCYKFIEPSGDSNVTTFAVFDLINFSDYDGIIITPGLFNDEDMVQKYVKKILDSKVPAVSIGCRLDGFHFVGADNQAAIKELMLHIIKEHHSSRFAFIGGPQNDFGSDSGYNMFANTITNAGLNPTVSIVYRCYTDWTFNSAYAETQKVFENKTVVPNAIVCSNHSIAMAVIKLAVEKGYSVPDDIIVISFEDGDMASKIIPSLSAINVNPEGIGAAAVETLLGTHNEPAAKIIESSVFKRQSCGCRRQITVEQKIYSQGYVKELDKEQRFASQLRFLEDRFLRNTTIKDLCDDLQSFYEKRHFFEGPDFALCIDQSVVNNISETLNDELALTSFTDTMQTFVNIKDSKAVEQCQIKTKDLVPPSLCSEESSLYVILPIFVQKYVYGYYIGRNFTGLLLNKAAYNWTRNIGTCIEKYRQTSVYRRMSEQLQVLSTQDSLSGLLNRAGLHNFGTELFMNNNENNLPTEVIFVDINDMKIINDKFGHLQGDLAIKTVAEAISTSIPEDYIAVRYGGDEFLIIGNPKKDEDYCGKITDELKNKAVQMSLPYKLTASIGCKVFAPKETEILTDAINIVDNIMYQKKAEYHKNNG